MSETAWVAIVTALITGIIAAIPPTIFALRAGRKSDEAVAVGKDAVAESKKTTEKADIIIGKADEIHVTTNGHLSKVQSALEVSDARTAVLNEKIIGLEKLIANMIPVKKE